MDIKYTYSFVASEVGGTSTPCQPPNLPRALHSMDRRQINGNMDQLEMFSNILNPDTRYFCSILKVTTAYG